MTEQLTEEIKEEKQKKLKDEVKKIKQKAQETEELISENINDLLDSTAKTLDKTAAKMHQSADFLKSKNVNVITNDLTSIIKKNPIKSLIGALFLGGLTGKIFFR